MVYAADAETPATSMTKPLQSITLDIPHYGQDTPVWCWAAVAQMVIAHFQGATSTPTQKELVRMALGQPESAIWSAGVPADAVVPNDAHFIRLLIKVLARRVSDWFPPCPPEEIYANLYFGNPVILHVMTSGATSHVVVVAGVRPDGDGHFEVLLNDPSPRVPGPFWARYDSVQPAVVQHLVVYRDIHL
jgi:hypothetical protein